MEGYPKTKYPVMGGGSITVASPAQEKQLGPDWQDNPPFRVTVSQEVPVETVESLPKRRGRPPKKAEEPTEAT